MDDRPLIGKHGGYQNLHSYRLAEVIYDATVIFCDRFIDPRSRTRDQMIQASRSGKQNIAEGSVDSATSKKSELKLTGIARGSLVELQIDFEDYLRQNGLPTWDKDDPRCTKIRAIAFAEGTHRYRRDISFALYAKFFERTSAEISANTAICLIHQATYLLNRLLKRLEDDFVSDGGFTEKLYRERMKRKKVDGEG